MSYTMRVQFNTRILGCSAALPTSLRHTTVQLLRHDSSHFLLDCAEGTQMQLRRLKLPLMKIDRIFISHLHGDHYLGLPGLLFTYHLLGRDKDIHIYSPPGLDKIIEIQNEISRLRPSFEVIYHEINKGGEVLYSDSSLSVESIEMEHRIPTYGFLFRESEAERNIRKDSISRYNIPVSQMPGIKKGDDLKMPGGQIIPNEKITTPPSKPRSYAFCSDTGYTESYLEQIAGTDLLYHEATFMADKAEIAKEKTHCTTIEAATIAKKAGVKKLMIGHYSARYKELGSFLKEAESVFPNTILAREGELVEIGSEE